MSIENIETKLFPDSQQGHFLLNSLSISCKTAIDFARDLLGDKSDINTERYTRLSTFGNEKYHHATAKDDNKAGELIDDEFEYILTTPQGTMMFGKLK